MKPYSAIFVKNGCLSVLPFYAIMEPYFLLTFCMLLAHIVDYNMCKIYFVSFTYKKNITFDTAPFREIDMKQI